MRRLVLLFASGFASAVAACGAPPSAPSPSLACEPLPGAEALLGSEAVRLIMVGAASPAEAQALVLTACAALNRGDSIAAFVPAGPEGEALRATLLGWGRQGAAVRVAALPAVDPSAPEAAQQALAEALVAASAAERTIALLDADSAARRPLGLSGQTWRPAGALLPPEGAISLRAMQAPGSQTRLSLAPFEDIPAHGAARAYDGLITLPTPALEERPRPGSSSLGQSPAHGDDLRGR